MDPDMARWGRAVVFGLLLFLTLYLYFIPIGQVKETVKSDAAEYVHKHGFVSKNNISNATALNYFSLPVLMNELIREKKVVYVDGRFYDPTYFMIEHGYVPN